MSIVFDYLQRRLAEKGSEYWKSTPMSASLVLKTDKDIDESSLTISGTNLKEISGEISKLQNEFNVPYSKKDGKKIVKKTAKEYNLADLKQLDLFTSYQKYIDKYEEDESLKLDLEKQFSQEEETEKLIIYIYEKARTFDEIFQRAKSKLQLIYMFLSILDLYKDGTILIDKNVVYKRGALNV